MNVIEPKWEDLKVYQPLKKEDLKAAYKDFTKIVADNLSHFGFMLNGRRLIKQSNDLLHVIHLDTRGSWTGITDSFEVQIAIATVYDKETFVRNYELTGSKKIEEIIPKIRNHYRITQEYKLLADFLTRQIIDHILPYFDKYNSSAKILGNRNNFKLGPTYDLTERNTNLILFSELHNHLDNQASAILNNKISFLKEVNKGQDTVQEFERLLQHVTKKDWGIIDGTLIEYKAAVFKKVKFK